MKWVQSVTFTVVPAGAATHGDRGADLRAAEPGGPRPELLSQLHSVSLALPFSLQLYAGLELAGVNYRKCRVMSSKKLPLFLSFVVNTHEKTRSILGEKR